MPQLFGGMGSLCFCEVQSGTASLGVSKIKLVKLLKKMKSARATLMGPSLLFLEEFWPGILTYQRFSIIIRGSICLYPNMSKIFKEIIF